MRKGEQELPDWSVCLPVWAFFSVFSVASVAASQCRSVALLLHCSAVLQVSLWIVCAGDTWQLKLKCRRHRCTYLLGSAHGLGFPFPFPTPLPVSHFPFGVPHAATHSKCSQLCPHLGRHLAPRRHLALRNVTCFNPAPSSDCSRNQNECISGDDATNGT